MVYKGGLGSRTYRWI